jgi:hypothetical protein
MSKAYSRAATLYLELRRPEMAVAVLETLQQKDSTEIMQRIQQVDAQL